MVTLVVGYDPRTTQGEVTTPMQAARAALDLIRDDDSPDTVWHVYDRTTRELHQFEQSEFDHQHRRLNRPHACGGTSCLCAGGHRPSDHQGRAGACTADREVE